MELNKIDISLEENSGINLDAITLEDCLDMHNFKDSDAIINDGKVVGFDY